MTKKPMVCYKSNGAIIYYADHTGQFHFVPKFKWAPYLCKRKQTPFRCSILDTKEEARLAAIEHGDRPEVWGSQIKGRPDYVRINSEVKNLSVYAKDHLSELQSVLDIRGYG